MPLLTLAVTIPLAGAVLAAALPARLERAPQRIALAASALALLCLLATWARFDPGRGMQLVEEATWIPSLDVAWRLGGRRDGPGPERDVVDPLPGQRDLRRGPRGR